MGTLKMEGKITLYPSNWLYNAGVVGFLRVVEEMDGKFEFLGDGRVMVDIDSLDEERIFEKWEEFTYKKLKISYKSKEGGTQKYYYANQTEKSIKDKISLLIKMVPQEKRQKGIKFSCTLCGRYEYTTFTKMEKLNQTFGNILLGSEKSFPNTYWMFKSREFICSRCEFILMCHHISLIPTKEKDIRNEAFFINIPHFNIAFEFNTFAENIFPKREYTMGKLLGTTLLEWAIKKRTLLGTWTMMNIEIIVKKRIEKAPGKYEDIIDYFDLPYHTTRILLDYEIASLIKRINEEKIFDLILSGKFSELEKANYFVLRTLLKLKNKETISDNEPVTKYVDIDKFKKDKKLDTREFLNHIKNISPLLPELYAKILKILNTEVKYG